MHALTLLLTTSLLTAALTSCGSDGSAPEPATTATIDRISVTLQLDEPAHAQVDGVSLSGGQSTSVSTDFYPGASGRFTSDAVHPPQRTMHSELTLTDRSGNLSQQTLEVSMGP